MKNAQPSTYRSPSAGEPARRVLHESHRVGGGATAHVAPREEEVAEPRSSRVV